MTKEEKKQLQDIASSEPWLIRKQLNNYLETVEMGEPLKRTSKQNRALHLWFTKIAHECRETGIDAKMLMSKTMSVEVNMEIIKGMWKALQYALYKTKSTKELNKIEQIDKLSDHFIRFFAEKLHIELPPFPHEEITNIKNMERAKVIEYPEDYNPPTI